MGILRDNLSCKYTDFLLRLWKNRNFSDKSVWAHSVSFFCSIEVTLLLTGLPMKCCVLFFCIIAAFSAQAQVLEWTPTQGPYSTQINGFGAFSGQVFACTDKGLYKSGDNGDTWKL